MDTTGTDPGTLPGRASQTVSRVVTHPLFPRVILLSGIIAGVFLVLGLGRGLGFIDPELWEILQLPLQQGATNTMLFSITIIPFGAVIGFAIGWARFSRHPLLAWPAAVYVDIIRGIPQLVLILFAFFWLPFILRLGGTFQSGLWFAVFALVIHTSAYQAEIFRAGFQSIPRGQIEAGEALGLSRLQVMRLIVLPQTFRVTLPALGNEFSLIIKDTSLLAVIGAAELTFWGRAASQYAARAFGQIEWVLVTWVIIALIYFVITYIITQAVGAMEEAYRVPGLGSVAY